MSGRKLIFTRPQGIALKDLSHKACRLGLARRRLQLSPSSARAKVRSSPGSPATRVVALCVSLVVSALLTAAALRLPDQQWLAWISFLPLFVAVRSLRPPTAALAGGFWGGCLYLFCTAGPAPSLDPTVITVTPTAWLLALLIVIPAVYVGLAARPARSIGFKLLILAFGWTLIEVVLHLHNPSEAYDGLLTASQGEALHLHWLARLLGYVATALLVGCANASLVIILNGARLSFPASRSLVGSPNAIGWLPSQVSLSIQSWILHGANPRGPPISTLIVYT